MRRIGCSCFPFSPMRTITVPTIRSFEQAGRYVAAGESLTVTPVEALALARRGVVSLTRVYETREMCAAPIVEPEPEKPRRRRRKTSDGDAPKRAYRRRDMAAEG